VKIDGIPADGHCVSELFRTEFQDVSRLGFGQLKVTTGAAARRFVIRRIVKQLRRSAGSLQLDWPLDVSHTTLHLK
jgi:hypothetical protein